MREPNETWYNWGWLFSALASIAIITIWLQYVELKQLRPLKDQIKPCKCLSLSEMMLYTEKYAMYTDSLEYAPKKHKQRLTDSLVFYYNALRVNENPINIEK